MVGKKVDKYRIQEILGIGTASIIYKVIDVDFGTKLVLKMIDPSYFRDATILRRFREDAQRLAKAKHPNIATVHRLFEEDGDFFVLMEYVCGQKLDEYIYKYWPISWKVTYPIIEQTLQAINHAHKHGVFHRDIKPSNIMLTDRGFIKVMDFGLEKFYDHESESTVTPPQHILKYMSPERVRLSPNINYETSDIYSLGMTLYEILAGRTPFAGAGREIQRAILRKKFASPNQLNPDIPESLALLVMHAIEKEPQMRYQTVKEMLEALKKFQESIYSEPSHKRLSAPRRKSYPRQSSLDSRRPYYAAFSVMVGLLLFVSLFSNTFGYRLRILNFLLNPKVPAIAKMAPNVSNTEKASFVRRESPSLSSIPEKETEVPAPSNNEPLFTVQKDSPSRVEPNPLPLSEIRLNSQTQRATIQPDSKNLGLIPKKNSQRAKVRSNENEANFQAEPGRLEVLVKPFGSIYIDEKLLSKDSDIKYSTELPAGDHLLRIEHPLFGMIEKTINIVSDQIQKINFDFNRVVILKVLAFDGFDNIVYGEIFLDGESTGRYTPSELELRVGQHTIAIGHADYLMADEEVNLETDRKLRFVLQRKWSSRSVAEKSIFRTSDMRPTTVRKR